MFMQAVNRLVLNHILKTPALVSSMGALSETATLRPNTRRKSSGKIIPSSHSLEVE